jgi:AcrR family transcriptional regulator
MNVKSRKAEQSEATRAALLTTAEALFGERGYAATATEELVQRAGVTRGALYHHFKDKRDLFLAVFIAVEERLTAKLAEVAVGATDPWQALVSGAHAFLDACMEPHVQRIVLLDAPSVLGWQEWREVEARYGLGLLKEALRSAMEAKAIGQQPVDPLAHLLLAALNEAALFIAQAKQRKAARKLVGATVDNLLASLRSQAATM